VIARAVSWAVFALAAAVTAVVWGQALVLAGESGSYWATPICSAQIRDDCRSREAEQVISVTQESRSPITIRFVGDRGEFVVRVADDTGLARLVRAGQYVLVEWWRDQPVAAVGSGGSFTTEAGPDHIASEWYAAGWLGAFVAFFAGFFALGIRDDLRTKQLRANGTLAPPSGTVPLIIRTDPAFYALFGFLLLGLTAVAFDPMDRPLTFLNPDPNRAIVGLMIALLAAIVFISNARTIRIDLDGLQVRTAWSRRMIDYREIESVTVVRNRGLVLTVGLSSNRTTTVPILFSRRDSMELLDALATRAHGATLDPLAKELRAGAVTWYA